MARRAKIFILMATLPMAALAPAALAQDDAMPPATAGPDLTSQDVLDRAAEITSGIAAAMRRKIR